jgi:hypothetical protein
LFGLVYDLAGGDKTKAEQIEKMNFLSCLDWLSYKKELNILINKMNKK